MENVYLVEDIDIIDSEYSVTAHSSLDKAKEWVSNLLNDIDDGDVVQSFENGMNYLITCMGESEREIKIIKEESAMKSVACFLISSQDKKLFLKI